MPQFSLTPPPKRAPRDPLAEQLALARVHPHLVPMVRVQDGYEVEPGAASDWFELPASRGLAGYGLSRALCILLDVLGGVSALHQTAIGVRGRFVHGELVPALLRVDDSGVSRLLPLAPWHWSKAGTLADDERLGHLSPERLLGDPIDQRADVFSAGVLLWEALAGSRLFETESSASIVTRLLGGKVTLPPLPPELAWAEPLEALAMRALAVDPAERFPNCVELANAINAVAAGRIATHAQVADYFAEQGRVSQPGQDAAAPSSEFRYHSSLSALVAPVLSPKSADAERLVELATQVWTTPTPHKKRWRGLLAATTALFALLGGGVVVQRNSAHGPAREAAGAGVPRLEPVTPLGVYPARPALSAAAPSAAAPSAQSSGFTALNLPAQGPPLQGAAATPAAPVSVPSVKRVKPPKLPKSPRLVLPTKAPLSAPKAPEPEAARYGI